PDGGVEGVPEVPFGELGLFGVVEFGFVVFGVVVFGLVVFGLVPLGLFSFGVPFGLLSFGVPLGFCPFMFPFVPLGFVVPGLPVFGFVVPGFVVPGAAPVGGLTAPVGGAVDPGVADWPLCPVEPCAPPGGAPPRGAACATIQVAHSKTAESKVRFLIDMMKSLQDRSATRILLLVSVGSERRGEYPADTVVPLLRKGRGWPDARQQRS